MGFLGFVLAIVGPGIIIGPDRFVSSVNIGLHYFDTKLI